MNDQNRPTEARYFFDTFDGSEFVKDETGQLCSDLEAVRYRAVEALPDIVRDRLPDGDAYTFLVRVRDVSGTRIFETSLEFSAKWL